MALTVQDQALLDLSANNSESGASSTPPPGRILLATEADVLAQAFKKPAAKVRASSANHSQPAASTNLALPASQDLLGTIQSRLMELDKEPDPEKAAQKLSTISGEIAKTQARFVKEAQAAAYAEFQVPQLMKSLEQNIQMDRSTPAYVAKFGMTDSDETAAVRSRLTQAKSAADGSINERLATNDTYQQLITSSKSLLEIGQRRWQKTADREALIRNKGEEYMLGLSTEGKARANILNPEAAADPGKFFMFMKGQPEKIQNDMEMVLRAREEEIPQMALRGSTSARYVLEKAEASKIGPQAREFLKVGYAIADDTAAAQKALKEMTSANVLPAGHESVKALEKQLSPIADVLGDKKEASELSARARAQVAMKYMQWKNVENFNSDMLSVGSAAPLPSFLQAASKDPALNPTGKISKDQAIVLATKGVDKAQAQQNMAELSQFYNEAAKQRSRSGLFAISPWEVSKMNAEGAMTVAGLIGQKLGPALNAFASDAKQNINALMGTLNLPFHAIPAALTTPVSDLSLGRVVNRAYQAGKPFEEGK